MLVLNREINSGVLETGLCDLFSVRIRATCSPLCGGDSQYWRMCTVLKLLQRTYMCVCVCARLERSRFITWCIARVAVRDRCGTHMSKGEATAADTMRRSFDVRNRCWSRHPNGSTPAT